MPYQCQAQCILIKIDGVRDAFCPSGHENDSSKPDPRSGHYSQQETAEHMDLLVVALKDRVEKDNELVEFELGHVHDRNENLKIEINTIKHQVCE